VTRHNSDHKSRHATAIALRSVHLRGPTRGARRWQVPWSWSPPLAVGQRMNVSTLGPDNVGKNGIGGSKWLLNGERGRSGDAIGKTNRGMLAVVAASADPARLDRHFRRHGYQSHAGVTEQREVGFDSIGIAAEDANHLVADLCGVDRR